jgi:hypothetical protein
MSLFAALADHSDPRRNRLIAASPEAEWLRWQPLLEWVELPLGEVMYESGRTLSHVYFPTSAIVSSLYVMEDGGAPCGGAQSGLRRRPKLHSMAPACCGRRGNR